MVICYSSHRKLIVVDTSAFDGTDCNVFVLFLFRETREKLMKYLHSIKKKKKSKH